MARIPVTKIIMDNGEAIKIQGTPEKIMDKLIDEKGIIRDEFIKYGLDYINPRHVSLLRYEEEEDEKNGRQKILVEFKEENKEQNADNEEDPLVYY